MTHQRCMYPVVIGFSLLAIAVSGQLSCPVSKKFTCYLTLKRTCQCVNFVIIKFMITSFKGGYITKGYMYYIYIDRWSPTYSILNFLLWTNWFCDSKIKIL